MHDDSRMVSAAIQHGVAAAFLLSVACSAGADTYPCSLGPPSSANNVGQFSIPLAGTFIGNYDAATNPSGTQTRPGFSGGSGNNPINYTSSIVGDAGFAASPSGTFRLELDPAGSSISGLSVNLTGGTAQQFDVTLNINYQTFRTIAPNSTFPGGFTIPIPLAVGQVNSLVAIQTAPAALVLGTPDSSGTPFTALVPAAIALDAEFSGAPVGGDPQDVVIPIIGRYTITGSSIAVTASLSLEQQTAPIPAPPPIDRQPLALPTVLPAGGTANLLLSGTFAAGSFTSGFSASLTASGLRQLVGDINGDGVVSAADLTALLAAWGSSQASADLDGNGTVNGIDLARLLANWG